MRIISAECGYQTLVIKICNGGRTSYILTNFISNISALVHNRLLSVGQTVSLHPFISQFYYQRISENISADTDMSK